MENLKFRVWDRYDKCMSNDVYLTGQTFYESLNEIFADEQYIFMQSTGLHDKNGKEIFEGDVLKSPYGFIGKVNIVEGAWYVQHNDFTNNHFLYVAQGKSEIIGNIHEHPELLEEYGE